MVLTTLYYQNRKKTIFLQTLYNTNKIYFHKDVERAFVLMFSCSQNVQIFLCCVRAAIGQYLPVCFTRTKRKKKKIKNFITVSVCLALMD